MAERLLLVALGALLGACTRTPSPAAAADPEPAAAATADSAEALRLAVVEREELPAWRYAGAAQWASVPATRLLLSRSPPLFPADVRPAEAAPVAEVQAVRAGATLYLRLRWSDPSEERSRAAEARPYAEGALYSKPTLAAASFHDAAAVMVPAGPGWKARFPSLVMGEASEPVRIFFWRHGEPATVLEGRGRGTVAFGTGAGKFEAAMVREEAGWAGVFALPAGEEPERPLGFAFWDGARAQRNGDKFFSPWYRPVSAR